MSSKRKIDESAVLSELSESRFFKPPEGNDVENIAQQGDKHDFVDQVVNTPVDKSVDPSTSQPISQSASKSTGRPRGESFDKSVILGRPKSFYITKKQDKDLDELVQKLAQKLEGKINQKIDRSLAVRLILEANNITGDQTVALLARRLVDKLVNQLVD